MKIKYLLPFLITFIVAWGCEKSPSKIDEEARLPSVGGEEALPQSESLQTPPHSPPAAPNESSADKVRFHLNDLAQESEMRQLLDRISDAKLTKFHITHLKSGTLHEILGVNEKKLLAWNGAGRRLYSSVEEAQKDGFAVWEFG